MEIVVLDATHASASDVRPSGTDSGPGVREREPQRQEDALGPRTCQPATAVTSGSHGQYKETSFSFIILPLSPPPLVTTNSSLENYEGV